MKKQMLMVLLIVGMLIGAGGCNSIECDGFSIGAAYINSDITTTSSIGHLTGNQTTTVEGLMPMVLFNFKFK